MAAQRKSAKIMPADFPFSYFSAQNEDENFMLEALKEAWKAFQTQEVPVGAVLVREGQIIARTYNQVELLKDATAHAELLCVNAGSTIVDNWRLTRTTLYCTIEPCAMCAGALLLARVPALVWGAPDIRHGANGSWVNLLDKQHPTHAITIRQGILQDFCAQLMKEFFKERRLEKGKVHG